MTNDLIVTKSGELPIKKGGINNLNYQKSEFEITIKKIRFQQSNNFDEQLAWICASLGFFENVDKNKNAAQIFKEIFLSSSQGQVLTSTSIAQRVGMSRGSVINHLNKLKKAGLIEKGGKYYFTRHRSMQGILEEIEDDLTHIFNRMKRVAKEIDNNISKTIIMK